MITETNRDICMSEASEKSTEDTAVKVPYQRSTNGGQTVNILVYETVVGLHKQLSGSIAPRLGIGSNIRPNKHVYVSRIASSLEKKSVQAQLVSALI